MARLSDEKIRQIADMRKSGHSISEIARSLDVHRTTVRKYAAKYSPGAGAKGGPPPRGSGDVMDRTDIDGTVEVLKMDRPLGPDELGKLCKLDPRVWIPQHFRANTWQGPYTTMVDGEKVARKVQLYQSKASFKRVITEEMEAALLEFVRENVTALPKPRKIRRLKDREGEPQVVSWGLWDAHLGMYAWASEVGEDFDLSIASNRIMNSIDDMVEELGRYPVEKIWMPIGNDFMHFDSVRHTTTKGDHTLDTDTRYAKVFMEGLRCLSYMVERALEITDCVEIIYVPGNHDYTSSFCLTAALAQRFLNDPRVMADLTANPRKYKTHGGVILGYDHGQGCPPNQLHLIFAQEAKEHWTNSTYREIQIGHRHQRWQRQYDGVVPTNGVLVRMNPALCNVDSWHHSHGFISEPMKSVEAWRYDKLGYRGSHVVWARDNPEDRRSVQM